MLCVCSIMMRLYHIVKKLTRLEDRLDNMESLAKDDKSLQGKDEIPSAPPMPAEVKREVKKGN
jgi:hypothetical protein